ncbi:MAG TPA: hypothetical protein VN715_04760 [Roseiarcus sp.]|nr:hypothetical protein [Roseiarcus sp.]
MSSTLIAVSALVADAEPYVIAFIGVAVTAVGAVLAAEVKRFTGLAVDQAVLAKVERYIEDKAAQAVAAEADNLANRQIDVKSAVVAEIVTKIAAAIPAELDAVGLTTAAVAHKVAAAFGRLQASMTAIPPKAH